MGQEIEIKLDVDPASCSAIEADVLLTNVPHSVSEQTTYYYDTPERAIEAAGYRLRVRSAGGEFVQTVKPVSESAGLFDREEWEYHVISAEPDLSALGAPVLAKLARTRELATLNVVSICEVERRSWLVQHGTSRIQLDLDRGKIDADGQRASFAELELELLSGDPEDLVRLAVDLAKRVPARIGVLTKAERGQLLADGQLDQVVKTAPVRIDADLSAGDSFAAIVHACLKHYRLNEPSVLERRDASALHQCRVAMRRLRSAFSLFSPVISGPESEALRLDLKWFTAQLGEARNLDVYLERDLAPEERRQLGLRRERAYDAAIAAMNEPRFRTLFLQLVGWSGLGAWRNGAKATQPIRPFAIKRLDRLWRSIACVGTSVMVMDEQDLHSLRIQIKKLRYATEFLRDVFPKSQKKRRKFSEAIEKLQEALGGLNDFSTARAMGLMVEPEWLILPSRAPELLECAAGALQSLSDIGRYWRKTQTKRPGGRKTAGRSAADCVLDAVP